MSPVVHPHVAYLHALEDLGVQLRQTGGWQEHHDLHGDASVTPHTHSSCVIAQRQRLGGTARGAAHVVYRQFVLSSMYGLRGFKSIEGHVRLSVVTPSASHFPSTRAQVVKSLTLGPD